jgi:hypothetical protein
MSVGTQRRVRMDIDLREIMSAVGPNSALVFAAWIFMGFLQQRYMAAYDQYRGLISQYRDGDLAGDRHDNLNDQIKLYKRRCELMKLATNIGLIAAILLIATLIGAALDVIEPGWWPLEYGSTGCALTGLGLIAVAAILVIRENSLLQRAIDSEVLDIPDLARQTGQKAGAIANSRRRA